MCFEETTKVRDLPRDALQRELDGLTTKLPSRPNPRQRTWELWLKDMARRTDA